jgi:cell division protein FtsB
MRKVTWKTGVLLAVLVWVGYSWLGGTSGLIQQLQIYQENKILSIQLDSLQQLRVDIEEENEKLLKDDTYLKKVIRAELGMALPGEKVFRYRTDLHDQKKSRVGK